MQAEKTNLQQLCSNIQELKCHNNHKGTVSCIYFDKKTNEHQFMCIHCILSQPQFFEENKNSIVDIKDVFEDLNRVMDQGLEIP